MEPNLKNSLLTALLALAFGFLGAATWSMSGLADNSTRAYLLENPELLEDMYTALQDKQAKERLAEAGDALYQPFPGVVLGNPQGSRVMVEFSDYNCTYCRASLADVQRLIDEDPELKVVMREWPIIAQSSEDAARMALAAGLQGKYEAFHNALFANGDTSPAGVEATARQVGLDMERARADAASEAVSVELVSNVTMARELGFSGTPSFIAGDTPFGGMVGYERLKEALAETES